MKAKFNTLFFLFFVISTSFFLHQCNNQPSESSTTTDIEVDTSTVTLDEEIEVPNVSETIAAPLDSISSKTKTTLLKEERKAKTKPLKEEREIKTKPTLVNVPLILNIKNLASPNAPIIVGIYGVKNDFPNPEDQLKEYKFKPKGNHHTAKINGLKFGTYAIAIYQDENSDGKIGKNFIGIPTEGYAFSNNFKPTIKAPSFDDCKFEYTANSNTVNMTILK